MDAFPAFYPLAGRRVVIAGAGPGAEAKLRLLENSPATLIHVDGPAAHDASTYAGAVLAFIAGDEDFCRAAAAAAREAGTPVNVVDRPHLGDFTTPAVIDRGEVVAAIGTGGASPMLATLLRHDIEARVPEGAGRVAALFRQLQDEVRTALPDLHHRRAFLREALSGPAAEAARSGDMEAGARRLRQSLADFRPAGGLVQFIDARGPADLLTLRTARALAAADVICADADADADILGLARRDAERGAADIRAVAEAAGRGLRVARLVAHQGWRSEVVALQEMGVETEILPIAAA